MLLPPDIVSWLLPAALLIATVSWGLTSLVTQQLRRRAILDMPNHRSSHTVPVPRGGGWGVMGAVLLGAGLLLGHPALVGLPFLFLAVVALMGLSWLDDLRDLPAWVRFSVQWTAVAAGLTCLPTDGFVFQGLLPFWADRAVAALGWVWFVNLFNFMDGIDGLTGTQMVVLGAGLTAVWLVAGERSAVLVLPVVLGAAGLGFLRMNWHPARVFMGDVGSIPVGYLFGWLLLWSASRGWWMPALILPAYYLTDATVTLVRRALRGERVWTAHREHFYQQAVRRGWSHSAVAGRIGAAGAGLIGCAVGTFFAGAWMLLLAGLVIAGLVTWLVRAKPRVVA